MNKYSLCLVFILLLLSPNVSADVLTTVDNALEDIYGKDISFQEQRFELSAEQVARIENAADIIFAGKHSADVIRYRVVKNGKFLGYAFKDVVMGKWGLIYYLAGLDSQGKVKEIIILDFQEIRGKPVSKKRFLRQYEGKSVEDPVDLYEDIDGVTGATISSRAVTNAIRKILHLHMLLLENKGNGT